MKIVADENIPLVQHYFGDLGELILKPGRAIAQADLVDADILLVRSVTAVNQALLQNTNVKFVGSATTGFDHIDIAWLKEQGIALSVARGCNSTAVVEYVICVIAALQKMQLLKQTDVRAGVIGVGQIGQVVADKLKTLGFEVVLCDPLRADIISTPLEKMVDLDFITLHTPLTREGNFPTYHLIQGDFLQRQKKNCVLLNSGRGATIAFDQLKLYGQDLIWCLDVWEHEPFIDLNVLQKAVIATPHIAGYSLQSKYRGIEMIYQDFTKQMVTEIKYPTKTISLNDTDADWRDVVLQIFDPRVETERMKKTLLEDPSAFDRLRKSFVDRYEFGFVKIKS
jgi:erythronate-4-phosphate dehydrogenase